MQIAPQVSLYRLRFVLSQDGEIGARPCGVVGGQKLVDELLDQGVVFSGWSLDLGAPYANAAARHFE